MAGKAGRAARRLLSARQIDRLKKPGRYPDGGNLYLQVRVRPDGRVTRSWIFRYMRPDGRRPEVGLGSTAALTLEDARNQAAEYRQMLRQSLDPLTERRRSRVEAARTPKLPQRPNSGVAAEGPARRQPGRPPTRQASKSQRTRLAILDTTLECLARLPYPEVTIAVVSKHAAISKGGIQYHFPSRQELLKAAVELLFERRLDAYRKDIANVPDGVSITDHIIDNHWRHLTEPEFQIYQQLMLASRSDRVLRQLLVRRYRAFMREWSKLSLASFGWDYKDPEVIVLGNIAQYLMDGMAYGRFAEQLSDEDVGPLLGFVKSLMRQGVRQRPATP